MGHDIRTCEARERNPEFRTVGGKVVPMRKFYPDKKNAGSPSAQKPYDPNRVGERKLTRFELRVREERKHQRKQLRDFDRVQKRVQREKEKHDISRNKWARRAAGMSYENVAHSKRPLRGLMEWYYAEVEHNKGMASRIKAGDSIPTVNLSTAQRAAKERLS